MTGEKWLGLDIGQREDPSALAIVEAAGGGAYHVRHLSRFPLGTPYTHVITNVVNLLERPELRGRTTVALDATGPGRPVVDMLRESLNVRFRLARSAPRLVAVTITSGAGANRVRGGWNVSKKALATTLRVLFGEEKIRIAAALPESAALLKELRSFSEKIDPKTGHTSYEHLNENRDKDDLTVACAIALWVAENSPATGTLRVYRVGSKRGKKPFRIVSCSRDNLPTLDIEDHSLLVLIADPGTPPAPAQRHSLTACGGVLTLRFADVDPEQIDPAAWDLPGPDGNRPSETVMSAADGKALWAFILRPRGSPPPEVLVIADGGKADRRALSLAEGVRVCAGLPEEAVWDSDARDSEPQYNAHIIQQIRAVRHAVYA
jgi:hypothetical protein